ncbi:MAG: hypothetical protein AAB706_00630 [Patescibacteria group bacterium]
MKKSNWLITFEVLLIATLFDIFIADPLPFVDEILLIALSIFSFIKA